VTPERWQTVKAALHEAMALTGAARAAYLSDIAAQDPALGTEVESLLAADQADSRVLETPAPVVLEAERLGNAFAGRRVGAYRLLEAIGAGGMGEIYRAIRDDDTYRQQVAVKLVRAGAGASYIGERLRAERQILANLEHPNIARLLDGGTTADGVPYLVMELVDGVPIGDHCERRALDTAARLGLFIEVCAAVQYAHRHMVIHRDLKPSNILVTADGTPKLLDFGIAKILDPGALPSAGDVTLAPLRLFTPSYASPEQLRGDSVTTATDVYSLGVILCELLTGALPGAAADSGARARERLDPDLKNILAMALREEPERRYATVEQFAQDLRRHLAHLPVIARPDTLAYRTSSFVRRHRVGVAAAALLALALIGGLTSTTYEALLARRALTRATAESRAADEVTAYLESLFDAAAPDRTGGKPIDARGLIDQGQSGIEAHLADQPLLRARMLAATGALYCKIGQSALCRVNLERALAIESERADADPVQRARMQVQLAHADTAEGRADEAIALLRQAMPVLDAQQPHDDRERAAAWYALGLVWRLKRQPSEAVAAFEQARALQRGASGPDAIAAADTLGALAIAYSDAGRWDDALSVARSRMAQVRQAVGTDDVRYVSALGDFGEVAEGAGRLPEAESAWRAAIDGYLRFYGRASDRTIDAELSLADVLSRRDELRESITWFRRAVDDYRAQGNLDRSAYAGALGGLSMLLFRSGEFRESEQAAREDFEVSQRTHAEPTDIVFAAFKWGHALAFVGYPRRGLTLLEAEVPGDPQALWVKRFQGLRLLWRGDCYRELGDYPHAAESYDEAIALYESLHQPQSIALNLAYEGKALMLEREGHFAEAAPLLRRAIAGYTSNQYLPDGPAVAAARIELADSLTHQGQTAAARALVAAAAGTVRRELAPAHPAQLALLRLQALR
jgi:tetratricopeptide (TPR) repeat protein